MAYLVDRRINGRHKSAVNRERFLRRFRSQIKKAVDESLKKRSITDVDAGESVSIPSRDIAEPTFRHGKGGVWETVHPGNEEYVTGDRIRRPQGGGGGGSGSGEASDSGEGEDPFVFEISREEFLNYFFEDLALPNLVKTQLASIKEFTSQRAGIVSDGTPNNLHVVRSMRGALGRRIALGAPVRGRIRELENERDELLAAPVINAMRLAEIDQMLTELRRRAKAIPFLDPIDLRYRARVKVPKPSSQAVMFCVMDVSGSMDESKKDMSKRFFTLLYLFLMRNYEKVELVFIRHHTTAQEVDEEGFFKSRETGGTVVSSALHLMRKIMLERYASGEWNIYGAQASDGDNWNNDSPRCGELLRNGILPLVQYFAYVEVEAAEPQNLWYEYEKLKAGHPGKFAMQRILNVGEIYPVFRELFKKDAAAA